MGDRYLQNTGCHPILAFIGHMLMHCPVTSGHACQEVQALQKLAYCFEPLLPKDEVDHTLLVEQVSEV